MRPEFARMMAHTNPHPLDSYRVNAPVANMPAFTKAFDCGVGSKMVRPAGERCRIW
jgi:predicted metalloendopeptidase